MILSADFWRRFAGIDNVIAIKIAPFNRYRTLDVLRGVAAAGALDRIALYTGNDDHILLDLTLPFDLRDNGVTTRAYFRGGLLGHWSVWTASAIKQFEMCRAARGKDTLPADLLALDARVTDCNSAFFDVANNFHGCIAGCHEILRRQGLLEGIWCLDPAEGLSPGQIEEIDRVCNEHADLRDDDFVTANLAEMAGMSEPPEPFIRLRNVRKVYRSRDQEFLAVSDVTMDVQEGELISLVGPSGCGKTTVLKILAGLHEADGGTIQIGNARTPFDPARDIGMVFQQALLLKWRTVLDNVLAAGRDRRPADEGGADPRARSAQPRRASPAMRKNIRSNCPAACSSAPRSRAPSSTTQADPDGRAVRRARCADARADEPRNAADLARKRQDHHLRHPLDPGSGVPRLALRRAHRGAGADGGIFPDRSAVSPRAADQDHGRIRRLCKADL